MGETEILKIALAESEKGEWSYLNATTQISTVAGVNEE